MDTSILTRYCSYKTMDMLPLCSKQCKLTTKHKKIFHKYDANLTVTDLKLKSKYGLNRIFENTILWNFIEQSHFYFI